MEHPARGLPRPRSADGRSIPFVTECTDGVPRRAIDSARLLECQIRWQCQVCGELLDDQAWVVTDEDDDVVSNAAMHRRCLELSLRACPYLRGNATTRTVAVSRRDLVADEVPLTHFPTSPPGEFGAYVDTLRDWRIAIQAPPRSSPTTCP
ncbi:hypothetical protein ACIGO9_29955 [Nocardia asteroides]|uniref:hypothetical protein n=1 Tax=Nocardia asteroides TaxID=1824 RepID=UPI0037CA2E7D